MKPAARPDWPSDRLAAGTQCGISEGEWFAFLEAAEPLFQWGGAFLFDERALPVRPSGKEEERLVRAYLRDDSGRGGHLCVRFDASRSAAARAGVERVEALARHAADVITAAQGQASQSVADLAAEQAASRAYTDAAEALWKELLVG